MPTKKDLKNYNEKYGDIPKQFNERIIFLLDFFKISDKNLIKVKEKINRYKQCEWYSIDLIINFVPKATPRARTSKFAKHFYVSDASSNSKLMEQFVKNNLQEYPIITTACKFYCKTYFPTPVSQMSKEDILLSELGVIHNMSKPDWDNLGKTYSDMIQKHLILDDSNIIDGRVQKFYSIKPRIEIHIEFMEKYDSKYNKKRVESRKQYNDLINKIEKRESI
jgi:Holliday junction resolvase RusA-like endonuclease